MQWKGIGGQSPYLTVGVGIDCARRLKVPLRSLSDLLPDHSATHLLILWLYADNLQPSAGSIPINYLRPQTKAQYLFLTCASSTNYISNLNMNAISGISLWKHQKLFSCSFFSSPCCTYGYQPCMQSIKLDLMTCLLDTLRIIHKVRRTPL